MSRSSPRARLDGRRGAKGSRAREPGTAGSKRAASRPPPASWDGKLFVWGGCGLYLGPAFATTLHAHHALQVCLGVDGPLRLRAGSSTPWRAYRGAVVVSDQAHQLDGGGNRVALLYLDPEGVVARRVAERYSRGGIRPISKPGVAALLPKLVGLGEAEPTARLAEDLAGALAPDPSVPAPIDPRVASALELLRRAPDRRLPLPELARAVGLSPSRLAHLFRAHTGVPIRRYLLWLRLGDALRQLARGVPSTAAAHVAGFSDSAHLSRTFRGMLGITPSELR